MLLQATKATTKIAIKSMLNLIPLDYRYKILRLLSEDLGGYSQMIVNQILELVISISDRRLQRQILKKNLHLVEIEIASFCNRTCWFCPNSFIDRKSNSTELDERVYLRILSDLRAINYDKNISFHRFNEPLANKELILKRVSQARIYLPNAILAIFTNGDYLNNEYLVALREAGVNVINMSHYFSGAFDNIALKSQMLKRASRLKLKPKILENSIKEIKMKLLFDGIDIYYTAWNPAQIASSRGGSMKSVQNLRKENPLKSTPLKSTQNSLESNAPHKNNALDSGCFQGALDLYIDYNGLVMPCCNTRSDIAAHKDFILGDVTKQSIFEIFCGEKFATLRRDLFIKPSSPICKDCDIRYKKQQMFFANIGG